MKLITEAGKHLLGLTGKLGKRFSNNIGAMSKPELAMNLAPDLMFGAMYGAMTPGDASDKIIAGLGSGLGGAAGGVGLRAGLGIKNPALGFMVDMGGSVAGDMVGVSAADQVLRMKNGGMTPMETENMKYQQQLEDQIRQQVMMEMRQGYYN
jgi:hypothetical protein